MPPEYRILTNPEYPVFDPKEPWWLKALAWLRLATRGRFVVVHPVKPIMCTNPVNVAAVQKYLADRGATSTVGPLLTSVEGEKK